MKKLKGLAKISRIGDWLVIQTPATIGWHGSSFALRCVDMACEAEGDVIVPVDIVEEIRKILEGTKCEIEDVHYYDKPTKHAHIHVACENDGKIVEKIIELLRRY